MSRRLTYGILQQGSNLNQIDTEAWYGVTINEANSSPNLTRISGTGKMSLHASLPVQSLMKACLLNDDGTVNYYLDPTDWTKKVGGASSNLDGADGQVMIEVNEYYRSVENPSAGVYNHKISTVAIPGWQKVDKFYFSAYEPTVQRSVNKLASVVNTSTDYRGGNNTSAWDAAANSLLGKPATSISKTNFRTYARNRAAGKKWNISPWRQAMLIYELMFIEYATLNSQKAVNASLTVDGYKQGGLGNGVTTANSTEWNNFNSYNPFINCGASNSIASGSGEVSVTITNFGGVGVNRTFSVPRYRGIENPFGHIWEWCDGASVFHEGAGGVSKFYTCDTPANFTDNTDANYDYRGNLPVANTYVKTVTHDDKGVIIPLAGGTGSGSSTYFCDYYYTPGLINAWRACLRGGSATNAADAGFVALLTSHTASITSTTIGSRLCYIP